MKKIYYNARYEIIIKYSDDVNNLEIEMKKNEDILKEKLIELKNIETTKYIQSIEENFHKSTDLDNKIILNVYLDIIIKEKVDENDLIELPPEENPVDHRKYYPYGPQG
jgi:hypothetical protein